MTDAIRNVSDPAKKAYLATIFFGGSGQKMVAMANMSKESLAELTAEFERLGGVMGEDTAKNSEIYQDSLTKLKTAMQGVGNLLVGSFLPALIKVIDKIRDWISENRELLNQKIGELVKSFVAWVERIDFDNLLKGIEEIIRGIGAVIDFCGGLKKAFIALMLIMNAGVIVSFLKLGVELLILGKTILPLLIMAIKKLSIVMIGAIRAIGAAMLANPIIIVITAIIAVVALLAYMIYKYWEPIKAFLLNLWETIKTATIAAWNGIKNYFISLWESIKAIFSTGWEFIKTVFSYSPLGLIIEHWGGIVDVFSGIWEGVKNGAVNAFTGIKDFIIGIVDWIWKYSGLDKVLAAIGMVKGWFAGDEGELPTAEQSKAHRKGESPLITPTAGAAQAEVVVRFDNMPRGAQASPGGVSGGFDLGLETSYALPSGVR
jgi:phage-related protein